MSPTYSTAVSSATAFRREFLSITSTIDGKEIAIKRAFVDLAPGDFNLAERLPLTLGNARDRRLHRSVLIPRRSRRPCRFPRTNRRSQRNTPHCRHGRCRSACARAWRLRQVLQKLGVSGCRSHVAFAELVADDENLFPLYASPSACNHSRPCNCTEPQTFPPRSLRSATIRWPEPRIG